MFHTNDSGCLQGCLYGLELQPHIQLGFMWLECNEKANKAWNRKDELKLKSDNQMVIQLDGDTQEDVWPLMVMFVGFMKQFLAADGTTGAVWF